MNVQPSIVRCYLTAIGLLVVLLPSFPLFSQTHDPDRERGALFTRYYSPKEYGAFTQNWAVLQDQRGVMVFANGDGVLKYDGVAWEFYSLPNLGVVRSLAMDESGRVYVGAYDELGYLDADSIGNFNYVSLLPHLTESQIKFGNIHETYSVNGAVIFRTERGLYIWENEKFSQVDWPENVAYKMPFLEDGVLYVQLTGMGLCVLKNHEFELLKGGEFFADIKITEVLAFNENYKLILTAFRGLFLYSENEIIPFETSISDFLINNIAYCGILLPDGDYAIGTLNGGMVIMDRQGKVKSILNKSAGLGDNAVYDLRIDNQGGLWAALSNGICRVEVHSHFTHFLDNSGLEGSIKDMTRFQGVLYIGTSQGCFKLNPSKSPVDPAHFEKLGGINSGVWGIVNTGSELILNTEVGAVEFKNNQTQQINRYPGYSIIQGKADQDVIFCGLGKGMSIIQKENGRWTDRGRIPGMEAETSEIRERANGDLWVSTYSEGIFHISFPTENGKKDYLNPVVKNYRESEGLSAGYSRIFRIGRDEIFHVKRNELPFKLYKFDEVNDRFIEYNNFTADIGIGEGLFSPVTEEVNGRLWLQESNNAKNRILAQRKSDNTFDFKDISFARLSGYKFRIVHEEGDIAWWGGHDGLVKLDISKIGKGQKTPIRLLINKISFSNDSIFFAGTNQPLQNSGFPYESNSIRFEYAMVSYDNSAENQYQYWLEGFDKDWSGWTKESFKSYTQIPEGAYIFRVKGKNIYDEASEITSYAFIIHPPWYRSWWAYLFYIFSGVVAFIGVVQWRLGSIKKEKERLEQVVEERTREVKEQAMQLENQANKLKELDQAKSHFFANISHEFRTPLTIILGLIEENLTKDAEGDTQQNHSIMHRSAKRLQNLIDQLLDLSKLEAKELKLNVQRGDIYWFLRSIAAGFTSFAVQRNVNYHILIPNETQDASFDADKLEKMVSNLLSNAFKFTHEGGEVSISAHIENGVITIAVEDTGEGIQAEYVQQIFDRFYQIDNSKTRQQEGAGIGLALTKELVELHHGSITVESQPGQGSIFKVVLPIYHNQYSTNERVAQEIEIDTDVKLHSADSVKTIGETSGKDIPKEDMPILLIVEDNADLRQFVSGHLQEYKIIEAANGIEGMKQAVEIIPDLIISDIMMPGMDGVELCRHLKSDERTSHIPVILLTAKADIESRLEGLETGADDYITKPFHAHELQIRSKNLIAQRNKLKERFSRSIILKPKDIAITSPDEIFLRKVMVIVEEHMSNTEYSAEDFQKGIGMSRMQLHRKLKALTGHSAGEFIRVQRLIRASDLLIKGGGNISDVCYQTGFTSLSYFAKCFKQQFGCTPKEFATLQSKP